MPEAKIEPSPGKFGHLWIGDHAFDGFPVLALEFSLVIHDR
jgi:hypothetical protein